MRNVAFSCILVVVILFNVYCQSLFVRAIHGRTLQPAAEGSAKNTEQPQPHSRSQQTALITGGARGIGRAYAAILLENDYKVVIVDKLNATKTAAELRNKYGDNRVLGIHCDVTDFKAYDGAFETATQFSNDGVINILLLNAGIMEPLFNNTEELVRTNLVSPIYATERYVKKITANLSQKAQAPCQVIVTGSLASFKPIDLALSPVYDSTKSGISQFVRSLKPIAVRYNFRINALCPMTMVNTGMVKPMLNTQAEKIGTQIYLNLEGRGGMMEPEDVAKGLLRVINDTSYNGDLIAVDTGNNYQARLEPLDEFGAYDEYGVWNEGDSYLTKISVDRQLHKMLRK